VTHLSDSEEFRIFIFFSSDRDGVRVAMYHTRMSLAQKLTVVMDAQIAQEESKCRADILWLEKAVTQGEVATREGVKKVVNKQPLLALSVNFAKDRQDRRDLRTEWLKAVKANLAYVSGHDLAAIRTVLDIPETSEPRSSA